MGYEAEIDRIDHPKPANASPSNAAPSEDSGHNPADHFANQSAEAAASPASTSTPMSAAATDAGKRSSRPLLSGWRGVAMGAGLGAAVAIGVTRLIPPNPTAPAAEAAPTVTTIAGQSVTVEQARQTQVAQTLSSTGSVDARDWVSVMPKVAGVQIQELRAKEGDRVEAGQVIAVLDNAVQSDRVNQATAQLASARAQLTAAQTQLDSARAQLTSAQTEVQQKEALLRQQRATLAEAESNLKRYRSLQQEGVVTAQDLESRSTAATTAREAVSVAQADISAAKAGVIRAAADVNRAAADVGKAQAEIQSSSARVQETENYRSQASIVQAPVSGVLTKRDKDANGKPTKEVREGDLTGTDPLFYLIDEEALELRVKVPESALAKVAAGAAVQITSDADPRIKLAGTVREVDPIVNEQTRQAIVKVDLPNDSRLKPGMFLKANVTINTAAAITVPAKAIKYESDGRAIVYVLESGDIAHAKPIEIGSRQNPNDPDKARVEIKRGLKAGDRIIIAGAGYLKDGDHVTVVAR